jgi:hypothetical protein
VTDEYPEDGIDFAEYCRRRWPSSASKPQVEPRPVEEPMPEEPPVKKLPDVSPLEATILLARRGKKEILPILRRTLDEHPELWQHFGNLAIQSQEGWPGKERGRCSGRQAVQRRQPDQRPQRCLGTLDTRSCWRGRVTIAE